MSTPEATRDEFSESVAVAAGFTLAAAVSVGFWILVGAAVLLVSTR